MVGNVVLTYLEPAWAFFTPHHGASGEEQAGEVLISHQRGDTLVLQLTCFYHQPLSGNRLHGFNVGFSFQRADRQKDAVLLETGAQSSNHQWIFIYSGSLELSQTIFLYLSPDLSLLKFQLCRMFSLFFLLCAPFNLILIKAVLLTLDKPSHHPLIPM